MADFKPGDPRSRGDLPGPKVQPLEKFHASGDGSSEECLAGSGALGELKKAL